MPNLSLITIAGHIGKDAELRYTQKGDAVASFSVAVNGSDDNSTIWYRVSIWRRYAEVLNPILLKGKAVTVIGDFKPRQYQKDDGSYAWSFDITGQHVIVAGDATDNDPQPLEDESIPF